MNLDIIANKIAKGEDKTYSKHSTQINLEDCASEKDRMFHSLQMQIKNADVYREFPQIENSFGIMKDNPNEEYGFEIHPHITILYGLNEEKDYFDLRQKLKDFGPIKFTIGNISSFRNDDKPYDVILLEIESPKLHELHNFIKDSYDNDYSWPEYKPHMTLAYVNKNTCSLLEGDHKFHGRTFDIGMAKWSHSDGYFLDLPLLPLVEK